MQIRSARADDAPVILALNTESEWAMTPLDAASLDSLLEIAARVFVADEEGELLGFAVALAPHQPYDSANYRWFGERYASFLYLDRIAVGARYRRRGVGRSLYDEMEQLATPSGRMLCEVNFVPPNETSLAFHEARGYERVGTLEHGGGKVVVMLAKELS